MAWLPLAGLAAGAVGGVMKHQQQKKQEDADRQLAATTQQYSPWTHLQAQPVQRAGSMFGDVLQGGIGGGMSGASLGAGMQALQTPPEGPNIADQPYDNRYYSKMK